MKQRIEIRNFGPIKHVDLDIKDFTLFIGPNASGKSTIAKLVWFCRAIKFSFGNIVLKRLRSDRGIVVESILSDFFDDAGRLFQRIWDLEPLQNDFQVCFKYLWEKNAEPRNFGFCFKKCPDDKNKLKFDFDKIFADQIVSFGKEVAGWYDHLESTDFTKSHDHPEILGDEIKEYIIPQNVQSWLFEYNFFYDGTLFIPAGRQAFSIPKDERPTFTQDFFMKGFYEYTVGVKQEFRERISQHIKAKDDTILELARKLTSKILQGEYLSTRDDERIYIDNEQYVKLYEASSGQQEALWILNSIFSSIEQKQERFTIIEEPEAHLYPETQKAITELISLLANQPGNQVMITTHSPYILSALNNLLYAHKVGKTKPDEVAEVIDPLLWVDIDRVAAYWIKEDGTWEDIIDDKLGIIDAEKVDYLVTRSIADEFDKILKLED